MFLRIRTYRREVYTSRLRKQTDTHTYSNLSKNDANLELESCVIIPSSFFFEIRLE